MKRRFLIGTGRTIAVGALALACAFTNIALSGGASTASASSRRPGPQPPFTTGFFGMSAGAELTNLPDPDFTKEMNLMQRIGVHWLRVVIPWSRVHHIEAYPEKWAEVDRLVNAASARGMQVDAIVDSPPDWAKVDIPTIACANQPSFNLSEYASFAAEVAARYPVSVLSAIELQNAPNLPGAWVKPDACGYTELMRESYPEIKAANPDITVLTGGLGAQNAIRKGQQGIAGDVFFAQMYQYGVQGYFDALSWHPYSYPCMPSQACAKNRPWYKTPAVRQLMVNNGDGAKQIWATEFGAPTNGTASDGHVDETTQSAIMVDGMQQWVAQPWAGPFFVFTFRDAGTDANRKDDWFGLVSRDFRHKKTAYFTYQSMARG